MSLESSVIVCCEVSVVWPSRRPNGNVACSLAPNQLTIYGASDQHTSIITLNLDQSFYFWNLFESLIVHLCYRKGAASFATASIMNSPQA